QWQAHHLGLPEQGPRPVKVVVEARGLSLGGLRGAGLAELGAPNLVEDTRTPPWCAADLRLRLWHRIPGAGHRAADHRPWGSGRPAALLTALDASRPAANQPPSTTRTRPRHMGAGISHQGHHTAQNP